MNGETKCLYPHVGRGCFGGPVENKHYIVFVSQQSDHNQFANTIIYVEQRGHVTKTCTYIVHMYVQYKDNISVCLAHPGNMPELI